MRIWNEFKSIGNFFTLKPAKKVKILSYQFRLSRFIFLLRDD